MAALYAKQIEELQEGEWGIFIEFCSNCHEHNAFLWHETARYRSKAEEIRAALDTEFGFFRVFMLPLETQYARPNHRLGLFEVVMYSSELPEPVTIASKLRTRKWPDTRVILNKIRKYFSGKQISFQLNCPADAGLHPLNPIKSTLRAFLAAECDLGILRERLQKEKAREASTTQPPASANCSAILGSDAGSFAKPKSRLTRIKFQKARQLCVTQPRNEYKPPPATKVTKDFRLNTKTSFFKNQDVFERSRIQSRVLEPDVPKENDPIVEALCNEAPIISEATITPDLKIHFDLVQPGQYKLVLLEDRNFEQLAHPFRINIQIRGPTLPLKMDVDLRPKRVATLDLKVEAGVTNPLYRVSLRPKQTKPSDAQRNCFLVLVGQKSEEGKKISSYAVREMEPGAYILGAEYKNYEMVDEEVQILNGYNSITVRYPQLSVIFFADEAQAFLDRLPGRTQTGLPEPPPIEPKTLRVDTKLPQDSHSFSKDQKTVRLRSFTRRKPSANPENLPPASPQQAAKLWPLNPSTPSKKQRSSHKNQTPQAKAHSLFRSIIPKTKVLEQKIQDLLRISQGDFLEGPRAFMKKNTAIFESPGSVHRSLQPGFHMTRPSRDGRAPKSAKPSAPKIIDIFVSKSASYELKVEVTMAEDNRRRSSGVPSIYHQRRLPGDTLHSSLIFHDRFVFGRIFVQRPPDTTPEHAALTIKVGSQTHTFDLFQIFTEVCNPQEELFCEFALIVQDKAAGGFGFASVLVPMREPLEGYTGISDLQTMMLMALQKKNGAETLFGFGRDSPDELPAEEVMETLLATRVQLQDEYVLNAVRANSQGDVSRSRVQTAFEAWRSIWQGLEGLSPDEEEEVEPADES